MYKRRFLLGAALLVALLAWAAGPALAQVDGCKSTVIMLDGSKAQIDGLMATPVGDLDPITQLMVEMDQGMMALDMSDLKSITRLSPPGPSDTGMLRFGYVDRKGKKGEFRIQEQYGLQGIFNLGDWNMTIGQVKKIEFNCPR
jgi:hypothetical protein